MDKKKFEILALLLEKSKLDRALYIKEDDDNLVQLNIVLYRNGAMNCNEEINIDNLEILNVKMYENGFLHKHDIGMITEDDMSWFNSLSEDHFKRIILDDRMFTEKAFSMHMNNKVLKMKTTDAAAMVASVSPYYYIESDDRYDMPESSIVYTDDDMRLPFIIRSRVDSFFSTTARSKILSEKPLFPLGVQYYMQVNSIYTKNALIRKMIREGNM